ncbi:hypothetical protein F4782DRAFT_518544 [Xylaria castorea]|nr:hypothetical protein F4782DRAFT_518544 [Xylaria castorea]
MHYEGLRIDDLGCSALLFSLFLLLSCSYQETQGAAFSYQGSWISINCLVTRSLVNILSPSRRSPMSSLPNQSICLFIHSDEALFVELLIKFCMSSKQLMGPTLTDHTVLCKLYARLEKSLRTPPKK